MDGRWKRQLLVVACSYIGDLSVSYMAWSSPVIVKLQNHEQTPLPDIISASQGSWLGAVSLPGTLLGSILSGLLSNTFGRKPTLIFGGMLTLACYLLLATADQFWMLLVGRTLNGIGAGIIYVTNLTYIAEISSKNIRGTLLTATGFFTCLGILIVYAVGPFLTYVGVMYVGFFLAMIFCIAALFIPETPSFYVLKGKEIEAKTTLVALGRSEDIEEVLSSEPLRVSKMQGLKNVFLKTNRRALIISSVLFICQGMSGFITVLFHVTPIFQSVNSSIDPELATVIIGVMQLVSSCATPLFVERKGRKMLLIVSTAGCSFSMALLGVYFLLQDIDHGSASHLHWLPLASIVLFLISYQSGYYTIPGAISNEMFDSSARGPGSSLTFSAGTIVCFTVTAAFGYIASTVGSQVVFFMFAGASAFCCTFTCIFVVETSGKSLAEVQALLR